MCQPNLVTSPLFPGPSWRHLPHSTTQSWEDYANKPRTPNPLQWSTNEYPPTSTTKKITSVPLLRSRPQVYQTLQHHSFSATLDLWTVRLCVIVTFAYFPSCSVMFQACGLSIKLSTLNSLLHPQFIKKATFCHDSTASHRETKTQRRASTANLRMSATSPASKPTHSEISASKNRPGVHTWLGLLSFQFFNLLTCISTACSRTLVPPFSLGPMADMAIMIDCEISTIPDPVAHNVGTAPTSSQFLAIDRPLWPGPLDRLLRPLKGYNVPAWSSILKLPPSILNRQYLLTHIVMWCPTLHQGQFLRIRNWEYCFPTSFDHQIDLQFLPLWSVYQLPYVSAQSCDISSVSWPFLTPLASQHDPVMRRLCQQATGAKPTSMIDQWIPTHFHNQKKTSVPLLRSRPQVYQTLQHHSFSATLDLWTVRLCVIVTFAYFPSCSVMFHLFQILWMSFDLTATWTMWLWGLEPRDANAARSEISARKNRPGVGGRGGSP